MGYRSDVALVLSKEAYDAFKKAERKATKTIQTDLEMLFKATDECYTHANGDYLWFWSWVKWYPEYFSVDFIENFLETIDSDSYLLAIIGEELDDTIYKGSYYNNPFNMSIYRGITFKYSNTDEEIYKISSTT